MRLKSSEAITFCVPVWMSVWLVKADLFLDGSAEGVVVVVVVVVMVMPRRRSGFHTRVAWRMACWFRRVARTGGRLRDGGARALPPMSTGQAHDTTRAKYKRKFGVQLAGVATRGRPFAVRPALRFAWGPRDIDITTGGTRFGCLTGVSHGDR